MRTPLKNRVVLGVVLAALVFAATHNIRAELPQAIGSWASLGTTPESRVGAAAVALKDGRTLIAGGSIDDTPTDSVVVFDPNDGSFSLVGHLLLARVGHTATLLDDGRILIAGGTTPGNLISADLELFDPVAGVSVLGGAMTQPRSGHAAAKLADGKVLIVGGRNSVDGVLRNAEVWDPETGTATPTVLPMLSPRTGASATTLIDGRVLVAGGNNGTNDLKSAEIFEPSSQIFEATTTTLSFERTGHAAVLLPNNNSVLIAGGSHDNVPVPTSDLFVPAEFPDPYSYGMGSFAQTGDLLTARAHAVASPHIEGYAVAMGGGAPEAEVYRFPTIKTDKDDYPPGQKAIITGSGWEPDSELTLVFQEDPAVHDDYVLLHVPTDGQGNFSWNTWAPEEHDLNVRFYLMAKQLTPAGERRAQTTFTDSRTITNVTLNGGSSVTVGAGASINAAVDVTTDNGGGNNNWRSTGWRISTTAPGAVTCVDHANHDAAGAFSESFSIAAPTTAGTYDAYFIAYQNDGCTTGASSTFTLANAVIVVGPAVTSINRVSASPTNASSVSWSVNFNVNVTNVDSTDFSLVTSGLTGTPAISSVTGSGNSYTVTATTGNGTGTLGLNLVDDDSIVDASANKLGGTGVGNGNFTGQTYSIDRTLTPTVTISNKVYNGTTAAIITARNFTSSLTVTEDVSVAGGTANFSDKNVGTGKTVTVTGLSLAGTAAAKYVLSSTTATATADITARDVTVTATGVDKVYDATTAATVTLNTDKLVGDVVTAAYTSATFANKNVGTGKSISATGISISGTDAGNYNLTSTTASATANITVRNLTVTATGVDKVYDGTTAATVTLSTDKVTGDAVSAAYASATFADKNAGTGKSISVTGISISGADAGNYNLTNTTASASANITARALTVSATGVNKVYDSTTAATVTLSDDRVSGDVFITSYTSASFTDKNVGVGKTVSVTGISISGTDAGNYTFNTTASATADITARPLTVTAAGVNKVYDGTTVATVTLSDDRVSGDVFTTSYTAAAFADKNVGTGKSISVTGISMAGADAGNYTFNTSASATADITPRPLTVTAVGVNKVYDGTTAATVTLSDDRVAGDVFTDNYTTATFADKNVGTGKTVSVSGVSISGTDASNYTLSNTSATTTADITARPLTVSAIGANKVYDGTTAATVTLSDDRVSGDVFTTSYTSASFADKNAGTGKTISVSGISISGTDAGNYTFNTTATATADITPRPLTVTAAGVNKVYDGTAVATVTISDDRVAGDVFTTSYTAASFTDKNVGTGKSISVTGISMSGADAGNYTFNTTASATADITPRPLTVSATGVNKVYDGTTTATVTLSDNRVSGDVFTNSYTTATFADKNVGIGKTISVSGISISGTDAGNYTFNTTASATADITPRPLTVTATGVNKVYDGTTAATVTLSDDRVSGDVFTTSYTSASFANKNVGNGKTISVSGISISGTDAGNYTFNATASATADITPRPLTVTAAGVNKVYDGTTAATVTLSDDRVAGDVFTTSYTAASFADKNVGTAKSISVSGISISGTDAGNYTFNTTASTTANITARPLTVSAACVNKQYDGTTTATVTLSDNRVGGDVFTDSYASASFADKNVGVGKTVSVSGISISGTDAGNYALNNTTATTTADITARALTVSATGVNKVYDGTTAATVTLSDDRVAGDVFATSYTSASFADKNVGLGKTVSVSGISISGADASNYTFNTTASTTADITARALTISATGVNKVYEGTTTATVTLSDNRVSGDVFTDSYTSATFADKNVGTGKSISVSGISISGADAGNYTFNTTASTTADITTRALTVSATGVNKVYDATTVATVTLSDDRVAGDVFTDSYTAASFANKNVGTGKSISVTGISISGSDAGNYTFNTTASTTADITARALTVSAASVNKVYDGTTAATVTLSDDRVSGDVFTTSYTTTSFADKNVGTGKTVSVSGISISGTDAGNYTFNTTTATTADITARALTVTATGASKVYDGTTTATVTLSDNRVSGDVFTDSYTSASFADKNVGTGKTVSVSGVSITGTDAGNYTFNTTASTTANITTRALTVSATGVNKVYDGTTTATVTLSDDRVSGDVFTDSYTSASFADKNVGVGKTVSVSGVSISGADAGNYTFNTTASTTADITARALTVSATGVSKVYDGTTTATVTLSDDRVSGDVFTDSYTSASFADKNVGVGKTVSVSGISISGVDASNYTFNTMATATANITVRNLTVTATGVDKVYDGTTAATVTLTTNKVMGDTVTAAYTSASFADKNVGNGKAISVAGISIGGADASNYNLTSTTASAAANITPKPVNMTGARPFDTTNLASASILSVSNKAAAGDIVTVASGAGTLAGAGVGIQPLTSPGSLTLGGSDAANYTTSGATGTVAIGAWTLTGFYNPITMGDSVLNTVKGGSTVPLKFNVYQGPGNTNERTDVAVIKPFVVQPVTCGGSTYEDPIDFTTTGGTTLRYDATAHQFIQNWQTPKTAGACYRVTMETVDGSKLYTFFKMK